ncbi:hypothetical protein BGZ73_007630 [Actinomortierella ambigua]|nr:hypothetical protein BGZ73_007630 [Actinomortierella ambigua]
MAAPKVVEQTVDFTPMKGIEFKEITNSSRLQLSNKPLPEGDKDRVNLFAVSNLHGCFAAATDTGFVLDSTERLRQEFKLATPDKPHKFDAAINVPITGFNARVIRFSADENNLLIAATGGKILLYSVEALYRAPTETKPLRSFSLKKEILDLQPNPSTDRNDVAAVLFADHTIKIVNMEGPVLCELKDEKFTSMGWSSKGKQIMCGTQTGSLIQYTPEGQKKKEHLPPAENSGDRVVSIKWLETSVILVVFCKPEEEEAPFHQYQVCIISKENKAEAVYYNYGDLCFPINVDVRGYTYFVTQSLKDWTDDVNEVMVLATTPSTDLGVIGRTKNGTWENWDLDDNVRPSVPNSALDSEAVYCVGLTFDLTSKEKIPPKDEEDPEIEPVPVLYVYDNEGFLSASQLINVEAAKKGIKCPLMVDPQPFVLAGAAKPAVKAPAKVTKAAPTPVATAPSFAAAGPDASRGFGASGAPSNAQGAQFSFGGQAAQGVPARSAPSPDLTITPKVIPPAKFKGTSPSEAIAAAQHADEKIKITRSPQTVFEREEPKIMVSPGMAALSQQLENTYVVMKRELASLASLVDETNALIKSRESLFVEAPLVKSQIETHTQSAEKIKKLNGEVDDGFAAVHRELVRTIHKKDEILRLLKDRRDAKTSTEDNERGLTPAQLAGLQRMSSSLEATEKRLKDLEDYVEALQKKANSIRQGLTSRPPALEGIHSSIRNISYALLSKQNDLALLAEELDRLSIRQTRLPGEPSKLVGATSAVKKDQLQNRSFRESLQISSQALGVSTAPERQSLSRQFRKAATGGQYKVLVNTQVNQQGQLSAKDLEVLSNLHDVTLSATPRRSDQPKKRMTATVPSIPAASATAAPTESKAPVSLFGQPAGVASTAAPSLAAPASTSGFGFGVPKIGNAAPSPFNLSSKPASGSALPALGFGASQAGTTTTTTTTTTSTTAPAKPLFGGFGTPATPGFGAAPATTAAFPSLTSTTSATASKPMFGGFALPSTSSTPASTVPAPTSAAAGGFTGFSFGKPPQATVSAPAAAAAAPKPATSLFGASTTFGAVPAAAAVATATTAAAEGEATKPPTFTGFSLSTKRAVAEEQEEEEQEQGEEEEEPVPEEEDQGEYDEEYYEGEGEGEEEEYNEEEGLFEGGEGEEEYEGDELDGEFEDEEEYEAYLREQGQGARSDEDGDEEEEEEEEEEAKDEDKPSPPPTTGPLKSAFGVSSSTTTTTSTGAWAAPSYSFPASKPSVFGSSAATTSAFPAVAAPTSAAAGPTKTVFGMTPSFGFGAGAGATSSTASTTSATTVSNTSGSGFLNYAGAFGSGSSGKDAPSPFATFGAGKKNIFEDLLKKSDSASSTPEAKEAEEKTEKEVKKEEKEEEEEEESSTDKGSASEADESPKPEEKSPAKVETPAPAAASAKDVKQESDEEESESPVAAAAAPPKVEEGDKKATMDESGSEEDNESEEETTTTESTARPSLTKVASANSEESFNLVEKPTDAGTEAEGEDEDEEEEQEEEEEEEQEPPKASLATPAAVSSRAMASDSEEEEEEGDEEEALSPVLAVKKPIVPGISPIDSEAEDDDDISSTASEQLPPVNVASTGSGFGFGGVSTAGEKDETASLFSSWGGISGSSVSGSTIKGSAGWGFGSTTSTTTTATSASATTPVSSTAWGGFGSSTLTSAPVSTTTTTTTTTTTSATTPAFGQKTAWGSGTATFGQSSFGQPATSGFGTTTATPATSAATPTSGTTSGFGLPSGFGQPSAFGVTPSTTTPASAAPATTTAFGQTSALGAGSGGGSAFGQTSTLGGGGSAFGQTSTLGSGGSAFGQTSTLGSGGSAFGQTSTLGSGGSAFGQTSTLGGGGGFGQTAFGQTSTLGGGFGQTAKLGSGFGGSAFGAAANSGSGTTAAPSSNFGSFASGSNAFAALAQQGGGGTSVFDQGGSAGGWATDTSNSGGSVFGGGGSGSGNTGGFGGFGGQQQQQQQQQSVFGGSNTAWGASNNSNTTTSGSTWGASTNKPKSAFTQFR